MAWSRIIDCAVQCKGKSSLRCDSDRWVGLSVIERHSELAQRSNTISKCLKEDVEIAKKNVKGERKRVPLQALYRPPFVLSFLTVFAFQHAGIHCHSVTVNMPQNGKKATLHHKKIAVKLLAMLSFGGTLLTPRLAAETSQL